MTLQSANGNYVLSVNKYIIGAWYTVDKGTTTWGNNKTIATLGRN